MRLTTARYYTPSGRSIQAKGIEPDIKIEQARIESIESPKRRRESDFRNALDNGDKKGNGKKPDAKPQAGKSKIGAEDEKPADKQDYQLSRALDLLRGLALLSGKMVTTTN